MFYYVAQELTESHLPPEVYATMLYEKKIFKVLILKTEDQGSNSSTPMMTNNCS